MKAANPSYVRTPRLTRLDTAFGGGYHVRPHFPIALDDVSEPEPDIAVVRGRIDAHPTS